MDHLTCVQVGPPPPPTSVPPPPPHPHPAPLLFLSFPRFVLDAKLLRFIVAGDATKLMHKDIKLENIFVSNAHDLELAELAVGDFGGAQNGIAMVSQIERKNKKRSASYTSVIGRYRVGRYSEVCNVYTEAAEDFERAVRAFFTAIDRLNDAIFSGSVRTRAAGRVRGCPAGWGLSLSLRVAWKECT